MTQKHPNPLLLMTTMGLSAGLGMASMTLITPSLPSMETALGVSPFMIGLAQSIFLVGLAVPQLIFGAFSDRFGHRPPLIIGMAIFVVGSIICAFTPNYTGLLVGRLLQALGASSGMVTSRALVRELYPTDKAAAMLGYMTVGMMVIPMIAPVAGGYIQGEFGWRGNFILLAIISTLLFALVSLTVPNILVKRPTRAQSPIGVYAELLRSSKFRGYAIQVTLPSAITQVFFACAPFLLDRHYHIAPTTYGTLFAIPGIGFMAGNLISGKLSERIGIDRMINLGGLVLLFSALPLGVVFVTGNLSVTVLFIFAGLISFGQGLLMPGALAGSTSALDKSFGSAAGLTGFLQSSVAALGVAILLPAIAIGPAPLVAAYVMFSMASIFLFHWIMPPRK